MPRWLVYLVAIVGGFLGGMLLRKAWRSGMVGYMGRSAVRGLIYRGVGALGK
jgi:hypothetical protein